MTKSDIPGCEVVVRETCDRIARRPELADIPVFAVSPPLADQAHEVENERLANTLAELSGVVPLVAALGQRTAVGRDALRIANCAHAAASVARILVGQLDEQAADPLGNRGRSKRLEAEQERLAAMVADQSLLSALVAGHLLKLRTQPRDSFATSASALRLQYRDEAQRGPAAQLATLAARMTADLTASIVGALDLATAQSEQMVHAILDRAGASDIAEDVAVGKHSGFDLGLPEPELGGNRLSGGLKVAGQLFPTLVKLIAGSAVVVSVLTGPGAIAASVALAAGAGWWRARSGGEQERRAQLRSWVDSSADQASIRFGAEMDRRVTAVQQYLDTALPALLEARRASLAGVQRDIAELRQADAEAQRQAQSRLLVAKDRLRALAEEAIDVARAATAGH